MVHKEEEAPPYQEQIIDWIGIFEYNDSSSDIFNGSARYKSNGRHHQMNIMTQNSVAKDGYASQTRVNIRGNLGSKMGLIRKSANNKFCELEFKNQ